jgi:hypothetical protein
MISLRIPPTLILPHTILQRARTICLDSWESTDSLVPLVVIKPSFEYPILQREKHLGMIIGMHAVYDDCSKIWH